ncbi:MAG: SGNH/GDSL hydrolase family protein [Prevotella sp.]|nr:SGNH/GDSL hydrolase family protein [Prevotella sp.]
MKRLEHFIISLALAIIGALTMDGSVALAQDEGHWVGTWATAPMLSGSNNNPPSPGLANNSLRQIIQVSIGGDLVRLKLSNLHGTDLVEINGVELAVAKTAGNSSEVEEATTVNLTFNGKSKVTMAAGGMAVSDPVNFHLDDRQNVAITIHYGKASSNNVCGHPGSRTTSYLANSNTNNFTTATKTDHWYHVLALEVMAPENAGCVAVLGNSITDGRGSTTNLQNRWTDVMSRQINMACQEGKVAASVGVLNLGIGGNCVLNGGLGPSAVKRYQSDIFEQEGVKWIILFEGVNDLGGTNNGELTARRIIDVWKQIIRLAHSKGIRVFGATITPFKGNSYYSHDHEAGRQRINNWMRTTKMLDGVIDFADAVCDPSDNEKLDAKYLFENDWLHLNAEGYDVMGKTVNVELFTQVGPLADDDEVDEEEVQGIWIEAESLKNNTYGKNFAVRDDPMASGGQFLETVKNLPNLSYDDADRLMVDFNVEEDNTYFVYARLSCPSYDDDSYFVSMDNGSWDMVNGLFTGGAWEWLNIYKGYLSEGTHRLGITSREDGACMDKICITTSSVPPVTMGGAPTDIKSFESWDAEKVAPYAYDLAGCKVDIGKLDNGARGIYIVNQGQGWVKKVIVNK